uniref:Gonadotropin-releasing hormone receptor 2a n=1 Tax=Ciona savignyi TaxID=51511 RepID=A9XBF7_CIOSA|nr:gonadotropin-releasing hormone receptor 2a [Ciona savignyi]
MEASTVAELSTRSDNSLFSESTTGSTFVPSCQSHDTIIQTWFRFDTLYLVRVLITWVLFCLSMAGNIFVLWSLRTSRSRHFIMFHLALSNLVYTVFVMPSDAIWNTTMEWLAGDFTCRLCQMMKQFGMYASSFMVVVIGMDRVTAILSPLTHEGQKRRGYVMVIIAWTTSFLCCIPAGVLFSLLTVETCEGINIYQCVDFNIVKDRVRLTPYYFFTMCMSFLLPLVSTLISYSLIVCEISNMKERDRVLMGRRKSVNAPSIQRAKNRTILMRTLITLTFLVCWGPYYGKGIYDWFNKPAVRPPAPLDTAMYVVMYLNPVLHPIVFGVFMKEIRSKFKKQWCCNGKDKTKTKSASGYMSRSSLTGYATGVTQVQYLPSGATEISIVNSATCQATSMEETTRTMLLKGTVMEDSSHA